MTKRNRNVRKTKTRAPANKKPIKLFKLLLKMEKMKNTLLLLLITVLTFNYAQAQQNTFTKVLYSNGAVQVNSLTPTNDGSYLLAGKYGYLHGLVAKIDSNGNPIWSKVCENLLRKSSGLNFKLISSLSDSSYLLVSTMYNDSLKNEITLCIKIDSKGDTLWTTAILNEGYTNLKNGCSTYDNGFVLVGHTYVEQNKILIPYLIKLNANGKIEWTRLIYGTNSSNCNNYVKQDVDSNYYVMLNYSSISKMTSQGEFLWSRTYTEKDSSRTWLRDFLIVKNGIVALIDDRNGHKIMRLNKDGDVLWSKSYESENQTYIGACSFIKTSDNGYAMIGPTSHYSTIIKTDSMGDVQFVKRLEIDADYILQTANSEYLIYGNGPLFENKKKSENYESLIGLIQLDSLGNADNCISYAGAIVSDTSILTDTLSFTYKNGGELSYTSLEIYPVDLYSEDMCMPFIVSVNDIPNNPETLVYPNPGDGHFTLKTTKSIKAEIYIFDTLGQFVLKTSIEGKEASFNLINKPNGLYIYHLVKNNILLDIGKLLINK